MKFSFHMKQLIASRKGKQDRVWKHSSKMGARALGESLKVPVPELFYFGSLEHWPAEPVEWDGVVVKPEGSSNSRGVLPLVRTVNGWRSLLGDGTKTWGGWRAWCAFELERHKEADVDPYKDLFVIEALVDRRHENGARFLPYDWKCYAIGGRVAWINQIDKTPSRNAIGYRTAHWWRSDTGLVRARRPIIVQKRKTALLPRPRREAELLEVADQLARFLRADTRTPFARIDLFEDDQGTVFLGEITPHPSGGREVYDKDADRILGRLWTSTAAEDDLLHPSRA